MRLLQNRDFVGNGGCFCDYMSCRTLNYFKELSIVIKNCQLLIVLICYKYEENQFYCDLKKFEENQDINSQRLSVRE